MGRQENTMPAGGGWWRNHPAEIVLVAGTLLLCAAVLWFRGPLVGRWAAWRIATQPAAFWDPDYQTLHRLGPDSHWGLAALAEHADPDRRRVAALLLRDDDEPWAERLRFELLRDPAPQVREQAAIAIAGQADPDTLRQLSQIFRTAEVEAGRAAVEAIGRAGGSGAVDILRQLATQSADAERVAALIDAIEMVRRPELVPVLLKLTHDERRVQSPRWITRMRTRVAEEWAPTEGLAVQADEPGHLDTIRERAAAALEAITGRSPVKDGSAASIDWPASRRRWAAWRPTDTRPAAPAP